MKMTNYIPGIFVKIKSIKICTMLILIMFAGFLILPSVATAAIGKISSFKGEVLVQSGDNVTRVGATGYPVNTGDMILTKNGEAQVTFTDSSILSIKPYSQVMVQERKEESGVLFFKRTDLARRVTVYLGKIWFKSGLSKSKNYLQSPNAVCGLRGSDGDFGFNPATQQTLLNMYSGEAAVVGNVLRGFFENPGISVAQKAQVYQNLLAAYQKIEQAKVTGKVIDQAQAKIDALNVAKQAATILIQNNPDATVKLQAQLASAAIDANIAAARADIAVELLAAGAAKEAAKKAAQAAEDAAKKANKFADEGNLEEAKKAAKEAEDKAKEARKDVPLKEGATTVAPTTSEPTTAAMTTTTTVETTISTTTTSSSSSSSTVNPISNK